MAMRVLAVIAAIGMIVGAVYVRTEVIERGGDTTVVDGSTGGGGVFGRAELVVACDSRLGSACPSGSQRMDTGDLVSTFTDPTTTLQAVVAPSAVVEMIEQSGRAQVTFGPDRPVAARSPIVLLTTPDRKAALDERCATTVDWVCVSAAVTGRALRPAFADPTSTSDGLAALAVLAGGYFTQTGGQFSLNGFNTGGFLGWLDAIQRESSTTPGAATNLVRFGGAQNDSAIVTEAAGLAVLATSGAQSMGLVAVYPDPLSTLDVVVAGVSGTDSDDLEGLAAQVSDSLRSDGWRGPDGSSPDLAADVGVQPPALADDAGLPSGGVLVALQSRW